MSKKLRLVPIVPGEHICMTHVVHQRFALAVNIRDILLRVKNHICNSICNILIYAENRICNK